MEVKIGGAGQFVVPKQFSQNTGMQTGTKASDLKKTQSIFLLDPLPCRPSAAFTSANRGAPGPRRYPETFSDVLG
jgi:hypothetical protein